MELHSPGWSCALFVFQVMGVVGPSSVADGLPLLHLSPYLSPPLPFSTAVVRLVALQIQVWLPYLFVTLIELLVEAPDRSRPAYHNTDAHNDGGRRTKAQQRVNSWNLEISNSLAHGIGVLWHSCLYINGQEGPSWHLDNINLYILTEMFINILAT